MKEEAARIILLVIAGSVGLLNSGLAQQARPGAAQPTEILERYDLGPSQLDHFVNGQSFSTSEQDVIAKILYVFPRFGLDNIARWRRSDVTGTELAADPASYRAQIVPIRGRAKRVEKQPLLPEQAELFEYAHYYRVSMALDDSPYEALILSRRVPAAWQLDADIDERAAADSMFLKVGDKTGEQPQLVFAAGRIAWLPDRTDPKHHIGASQLALAKLGMDLSLWDDIRESKDRSLGAADREAFYQLLAALGRKQAGLFNAAGESLNVVSLLEKPSEHFGDIMPVEGIARRVMKVPVSDADIRSRFGLDHYYEIDMFVSLGNATLRLGKDPTGEKNPVFHNGFPATLVVRQIPADLPEGDNVRQQIRADGVFFKTWTYKSNYSSKFGQLQPAPLFIGRELQVVRIANPGNWVVGALVTAAFAIALFVTGTIVWWFARTDKAAARRSLLQQQPAAPPDFSHLS